MKKFPATGDDLLDYAYRKERKFLYLGCDVIIKFYEIGNIEIDRQMKLYYQHNVYLNMHYVDKMTKLINIINGRNHVTNVRNGWVYDHAITERFSKEPTKHKHSYKFRTIQMGNERGDTYDPQVKVNDFIFEWIKEYIKEAIDKCTPNSIKFLEEER